MVTPVPIPNTEVKHISGKNSLAVNRARCQVFAFFLFICTIPCMNIRSLYKKVYIVLILSGVLSCLFLYLLFSGFTDRVDHPSSASMQNSPLPSTTPEATFIPSPSPSILPTNTPEIYVG